MLNTLKQLKHQHLLKQKTKRRAVRIEKLPRRRRHHGDGTYVHPSSEILPGAQIGSGCWINRDIFIDCAVQMGDRVYLGPRVTLCTASHEMGPSRQRAGKKC